MSTGLPTNQLVRRAALVVLIACVPILVWLLRDLIIVAAGALVLATLIQLASSPLEKWARLPRALSLIIGIGAIVALFAGAIWLFGSQVSAEVSDVVDRAEAAVQMIQGLVGNSNFAAVLGRLGGGGFSFGNLLSSFFEITIRSLEGAIVILVTSAYIAAEPSVYRKGIVWLFPPQAHDLADQTLVELANALRLWLLGQLLQMILIGLLTLFAMWILGVHSPIALGVISAICEFIPYLGPIIAAVPAMLVALTQSPHLLAWTLLAFIIIHQIEGHVFIPLIQRRLVYIPPAVMLLGVVSVQLFFGTFGVIFAGPMIVIVFVLVKKLYVRDSLKEPTLLPGEKAPKALGGDDLH